MKRLMVGIAAMTALAACGNPASADRQVASLSTTAASTGTANADGSTATTAVTDPNEAALQFAKCMREHGVDMPDPVVSDNGGAGGGVMIQVGGGGSVPFDKSVMDAANKDCQHFLANGAAGFDPPSPEEQEKAKEQALAFSKCMREHGVDMPDPTFGDNGTFSVTVNAGDASQNGPPPDNKKFQEASKACGQNGGFGIATAPGGTGPNGGFAVTTGTVGG
jgi:hypothetical protein